MIKAEKVEKKKIDDDFVKSTITGKVDDILRKKVPIELKNIFSGVEGQQIKVLIEGAPGVLDVGKVLSLNTFVINGQRVSYSRSTVMWYWFDFVS